MIVLHMFSRKHKAHAATVYSCHFWTTIINQLYRSIADENILPHDGDLDLPL